MHGEHHPFRMETISRAVGGPIMACGGGHSYDEGQVNFSEGVVRKLLEGTMTKARRMTDAELEMLLADLEPVPADVRPVESAGVDALDELLFRRTYLSAAISAEVLAQNQRSLEDQLLATKFAHPGPPVCATLLGLLAVGLRPTEHVPGAYLSFVRFDGKILGDPITDAREVRGAMPDMFMEIEDLLRANIHASVDLTTGPVEQRGPDYPIVALQQIVRNAILHRSYENTHAPARIYWFSDRVEIASPGGPFGQVTEENFGQPYACDYRNPNLAAVMKELGYVQRFGVGIATANRAMAENGNPAPEFQVDASHVTVLLKRQP